MALRPQLEGATGQELGCVLRVPPGGTLEEDDVTVTRADQLDSSFSLGEGEELTSPLLQVQVNRQSTWEVSRGGG